VHLPVIPRDHVASLGEAEALSSGVSAPARGSIAAAARSAGVAATSYRVITNTGPDAGQEVMHLHWHVIGGTRLGGMV
jgi:histidine triad (HIT) family protein